MACLRAISTHAPRTGSDCKYCKKTFSGIDFNPRSPHGERPQVVDPTDFDGIFQPTLPARGATADDCQRKRNHPISTHAPRTGSDKPMFASIGDGQISTHAPRTGSDTTICRQHLVHGISTHAPRTGSDVGMAILPPKFTHFNPRSPHGERRRSWRSASVRPA